MANKIAYSRGKLTRVRVLSGPEWNDPLRLHQELIDNPGATVVAGKENPNIVYGINEAGTNTELLEALEKNPAKSAWCTVFNYAEQQAKDNV